MTKTMTVTMKVTMMMMIIRRRKEPLPLSLAPGSVNLVSSPKERRVGRCLQIC